MLKGGYIGIDAKSHPRANGGYLPEHIAVVERAMGKPLVPPAQVHHVNRDRTDNRPPNLVACQDDAYHRILHMRQAAFDATGHADWRRCAYCGIHDDPHQMIQHTPGRRTPQMCHLPCRKAYQKRRRAIRRAA